MSEPDQAPPSPSPAWHRLRLPAAVLAAAIGGAFLSRAFLPSPPQSAPRPSRPIVQIVRPQAGLPDLSDVIGRLCPSVATIVARGGVPGDGAPPSAEPATAFAVSSDGWLLTAAPLLTGAPLDALFGDGRRVNVAEVRTDPVSGLSIVRIGASAATALSLGDQGFPRVGQFGFALATPAGLGCSADSAMIASDFLADGGAPVSYVRVAPRPESWQPGMPFLGSDGSVIGIAAAGDSASIIPAPLAAVVVDELIRSSASPSTKYGLRVIDFAPPLSNRLGNVRSGAGVAFVQAKSPADKAGLKAGDIVLAVNDEPVSSASELNRALDATSGAVTLTVSHEAEQRTLSVKPA